MIPKYSLTFHQVQRPITQLITKFGGQPTWLAEPQWPLSRLTEEPMQFICQVVLDPYLFGEIPGRMAYLFITDDTFVNDTFDPDCGENAVIIQPGICAVPTKPLLTGPSLYRRVDDYSDDATVSCEFRVELFPGEDAAEILEDEQAHTSSEAWEQFTATWNENKIGGTPVFLQGPQFPGEGRWRLLLQLDSVSVPFFGNFGDMGVGYAFLAEDGASGKFLWQCL